ncbi:hypothetical protein L0337_00350 [candidate division KSB1 bacterium]|nr:hypothetical protein [candidate division KSB1 bacterium]
MEIIKSNYLESKYRNFDLLGYLVEVWFLSRSFYEEQEKGNIPYDEPFNVIASVSQRSNPLKTKGLLRQNAPRHDYHFICIRV